MVYLPGSWYVGTLLQWFINLWLIFEFWPFCYDPVEWDDNERRGAGSLVILLLLVAAIVVVALFATGVI